MAAERDACVALADVADLFTRLRAALVACTQRIRL